MRKLLVAAALVIGVAIGSNLDCLYLYADQDSSSLAIQWVCGIQPRDPPVTTAIEPTITVKPESAAELSPTPTCLSAITIEDVSTRIDARVTGIEPILQDLNLCGTDITIRLTDTGPSYVNTEHLFGTATGAFYRGYKVELLIPSNFDDLEWHLGGQWTTSLDAVMEHTLRHELRHVWQFINRGAMRETQAEADADAYADRTYSNAITVQVAIPIRRPSPTRVQGQAWLSRMNSLIDRWNAWNQKLDRYVDNQNYIMPGYWDVFCGEMWMYEELQSIRRIAPTSATRWIDAWLAVDAYHEEMCKYGDRFPTNNEEADRIWGEWNQRIEEANRLAL